MHDVLLEAKGASDTLQNFQLNFLKATNLIESLVEELEAYRSDQKSLDYFENSLDIPKKNNLSSVQQRTVPSNSLIIS